MALKFRRHNAGVPVLLLICKNELRLLKSCVFHKTSKHTKHKNNRDLYMPLTLTGKDTSNQCPSPEKKNKKKTVVASWTTRLPFLIRVRLQGKVFGTLTPYCPVIFCPGPDRTKKSKFYGPDPGPTQLYFPQTGPDRNNLASTRN